MEHKEQQPTSTPLSPAARLFHSPDFSCHIVIRMGCSTTINPQVVAAGVTESLLHHPRFSSIMVRDRKLFGRKRWIFVPIKLEDHIIVPNMDSDMENADQFVRDYISQLTTSPLDLSKPLWEFHILNVKTSDAEAVAVIRVHHSMGDGASLMSLLVACTRQTSDPDALPTTVPTKNDEGNSSNDNQSVFWGLLLIIWSALTLIRNTLVDVVLFVATVLGLRDTKTPIKGPPGVEHTVKRFLHRTVSLDHIKQVKNAMNMTVNDVVLGVTQAGLSRYLNSRYGENEKDEGAKKNGNYLPKRIRLRANILVNLRPANGIQELADMLANKSRTKWGNRIGYVLVPFNIALQDNPLDYVRRAKSLMDRKKHSLEAYGTYFCANVLTKLIGSKGAGAVAHRVLCNSTLSFTNLIGPLEEISYHGHPVTYIAPNVYGHPHALHIHFQSYVNKMTISLVVDPDVIPDPGKLLDALEESLKLIRAAAVEKGLNSANEGRISSNV